MLNILSENYSNQHVYRSNHIPPIWHFRPNASSNKFWNINYATKMLPWNISQCCMCREREALELERKQLMDAKKEWNVIVCYKRSKPRPWGRMSTTHGIYKSEQEKAQSLETKHWVAEKASMLEGTNYLGKNICRPHLHLNMHMHSRKKSKKIRN